VTTKKKGLVHAMHSIGPQNKCAYSVFEGLLPEPHNSSILQLLFTLAHWHGLAKLRMHTDVTLRILDDTTTSLGEQLRHFQAETCSAYTTCELRVLEDSFFIQPG
jgi:hypothetical protein